jgi:ligand-binding SRPBCC domain-containing protein
MTSRVVEQTSDVAAPVDRVWDRVVSPEGINDEMRPWMTMTMPRGTEDLTIDTVPIGEPLGRAWIRLFGIVPIDFDRLSVAALEPGRSFHEKSTMFSMRSWQHERTLTELADDVTRVRDRVTFEPRWFMRPSAGLLHRLLAALFAHRHRRLARHFS